MEDAGKAWTELMLLRTGKSCRFMWTQY